MSRDTVEGSKKVSLVWLKSQGYFPKESNVIAGSIVWSSNGEPVGDIRVIVNTIDDTPHLRFQYKVRQHGAGEDAWRSQDYRFSLEKLPCHYGGFKWFVVCELSKNGVYCGRRARILYSVGDWFGCRKCADLTYERCNYSGRYKGFLSIPDLEEQEARVIRRFYRGKPTRKYRRLLEMERRFNQSFVDQVIWLKGRAKGEV